MINLEKGQRINLEKGDGAKLISFGVGLGWDANNTDTGAEFDLDASVFVLGQNGKLLADEYFVFYNNLSSPDGAVQHTGDNRDGQGEGDDESINIDLSRIDPRAESLNIVVTIHKAQERRQNFGQVRNSFIRVYDRNNGEEFARYDLDEDFSVETAVLFGRIYRRGGQWKFEAIGNGMKGGLQEYLDMYC